MKKYLGSVFMVFVLLALTSCATTNAITTKYQVLNGVKTGYDSLALVNKITETLYTNNKITKEQGNEIYNVTHALGLELNQVLNYVTNNNMTAAQLLQNSLTTQITNLVMLINTNGTIDFSKLPVSNLPLTLQKNK